MYLRTLEVAGFMPAVLGMRNPKNSWAKSDSVVDANGVFHLGESDRKLAHTLLNGGRVHAKFMRQIVVWVDINAPIYWWSEFDTYKVGVVRDSSSTMHTLVKSIEAFNQGDVKEWVANPEGKPVPAVVVSLFEIDPTNSVAVNSIGRTFRDLVSVSEQDFSETEKLLLMKKLLPSSWIQHSTIMMSYQNVRDMLTYRRNHRLPEWKVDFCRWAKSLPLAEELLLFGIEEGRDDK